MTGGAAPPRTSARLAVPSITPVVIELVVRYRYEEGILLHAAGKQQSQRKVWEAIGPSRLVHSLTPIRKGCKRARRGVAGSPGREREILIWSVRSSSAPVLTEI